MVHPERCVSAGLCIASCEPMAIYDLDGKRAIDRVVCTRCLLCAEACPSEALVAVGRQVTSEELAQELLRDRPFFDQSGGGVTLSGGEPLLQPDFAADVLSRCRAAGVHTAVDTAGCVPWPVLEKVAAQADLVLYDLKTTSQSGFEAAAGGDLTLVVENVRRLVAGGANVLLRTPVVPGFNADESSMRSIGALASELGAPLELLPYHALGGAKARALDMAFRNGATTPSEERMRELEEAARSAGAKVL
jgi:pyruvate formate lyase activating enzyme